MLATLDAFWQKASLYMNLPKTSITDIVEIIIIAFLIYYMLVWIKNTRAWMLLRGLMVILLFVLLAALVPDEHDHLDCKEYVKRPGDSSGCNLPAGDAQGA